MGIENLLCRYSCIRYSLFGKCGLSNLWRVRPSIHSACNLELEISSEFPVPDSRITLNEYTNNGYTFTRITLFPFNP